MTASHICAACRRNILSKVRHKNAQQARSTSTFVSLIKPRARKDGKASEYIRATRTADHVRGDKPGVLNSIRDPRPSYSVWRTRSEYLESLFEEGRTAPNTATQLPNSTPQAASLELYTHLETLKKLLEDNNEPLSAVWQFFVTHLGPEVWFSNGSPVLRPLTFNIVTADLLQKLKVARQRSQVAASLPSVTEILSVYESLGIFHPVDWNILIFDLLHKFSEQMSVASQNVDPSENIEGFPPSPPHLVHISEDILGAWRLLCKHYRSYNGFPDAKEDGPSSDWSFLCPPLVKDLKQSTLKGGLDSVFLTLVPRYPQYYARTVTSAALTTFALLTDDTLAQRGRENRSHPFIVAIANLLRGTGSYLKTSEIEEILKFQLAEQLVKDFSLDLPSLFQRAYEITRSPKGPSAHRNTRLHPLGFNANLLRRKLSKAMTERDLSGVDRLWAEAKFSAIENNGDFRDGGLQVSPVVSNLASPAGNGEKHAALSQELCNQFIMTYMGLRQQNRAIDVWNYMIQTALLPTLETWNAMLEGCKLARNQVALEGVWAKLQGSSTQPDMACWTTRISGLIECGKPDLGIRALDEMGRIWAETAKQHKIKDLKSANNIGQVIKPTIETINAAIAGLLRRKHNDSAQRVLAWGGTFGITPDIITFNILLRALIRDGRSEAVPALLEHMQKQGIQADVATFTTILDEMFKSSNSESPEEQTEIINRVFSEMEGAGVQANLRTYGKIIYSLLQPKPKDLTAVRAVMARMATQGLAPSTYIYTILIQYHFSQERPDLEAVRFLLERVRLSGAVMDHIFWDRVIEGYASVGDTASALQVLGKVDKEGSRVGWPALEMLLSALGERSEWDLAQQVVQNVKMDRGSPPEHHEKGIEGQHSFWKTVAVMGLMNV